MKLISVIYLALLLTACGNTKLIDHWQDETFSRNDLKDVLIVGITSNKTKRILFENEFQRSFEKEGIASIVSREVLGDRFPAKEAVKNYVEKNNIKYILATKVADKEVDKSFVQGYTVIYTTGLYYPSYDAYYGYYDYFSTSTKINRPSYEDSRTKVVLVTTIFDANTSKPVWIGHTKVSDPESVSEVASIMSREIWRNMSR